MRSCVFEADVLDVLRVTMGSVSAGLQQRVRAARESSVETRHRALALLATVIQKHIAGTPAGLLCTVSPFLPEAHHLLIMRSKAFVARLSSSIEVLWAWYAAY